jgi:hypothetical protein
VDDLRQRFVTPHVAQNITGRRSAIDERTTSHPGYEISQRKRKRVEEVFGWLKTIALQRKTKFRGPDKVGWMFPLTSLVPFAMALVLLDTPLLTSAAAPALA